MGATQTIKGKVLLTIGTGFIAFGLVQASPVANYGNSEAAAKIESAMRLAPSAEMAAQDASVTSLHPVVGAWFWQNISDDPFDDSYAIFGADGTYVEETPYIGAGIGAWQSTGPGSAELVIVYQDIEGGLDPNLPASFVPGAMKMALSLEISEDGNRPHRNWPGRGATT